MNGGGEPLQTLKTILALDHQQLAPIPLPSCVPAPRNQRRIVGHVFSLREAKPGLSDELLGRPGRHKVEELAWVTCRQGNYGRATRLFGAAEAQREAFGASMPPAERAEHDQHVADARARLAEPAFAAAYAEGRAMTLEQAIEYAQALDE